MQPELRARLEALLLAERDRTSAVLHRIEDEEAEPQSVSGGASTRTELTPAEAASDIQEETLDFSLATRASAHLARIDQALRELAADPEGFAACDRCGAPIERARLELVPWSGVCASCARADGRGSGAFYFTAP